MQDNQCLYCGSDSHQLETCPSKPKLANKGINLKNSENSINDSSYFCPNLPIFQDNSSISTSSSEMSYPPKPTSSLHTAPSSKRKVTSNAFIPITIVNLPKNEISTFAFLDSGATDNFIDNKIVEKFQIPIIPLETPITVSLANGTVDQIQFRTQPLCLQIHKHLEEISFLVMPLRPNQVTLGFLWLTTHNPTINWTHQKLSFNDPKCRDHCCSGSNVSSRLFEHHSLVPVTSCRTAVTTTSSTSGKSNPEIPKVFRDFANVFRTPTILELPSHSPSDIKIDTNPNEELPPVRPIYNLSPNEKIALKTYVEDALEKGWIIPSKSPISAPIFFVKKKDGTLRPCVDYRGLNKITVKNKFPLPRFSDMFSKFSNKNLFTKIDLRNAFYQVRVFQDHQYLTSFRCWLGQFEYQVMPFGLTNAPAVLQSFMNHIFQDMLDNCLVIYIDDILVFSPNYKTHLVQVREVLSRLRKFKLFAKTEKCFFLQDSVELLGFIISSSGVQLAQDKLQVIRDWPTPTSVVEVQSFLGFANYYCDAVSHFSEITVPLSDLTHKKKSWLWSPEAQTSFEETKSKMLSAPSRPHLDYDREFLLETDASNFALGASLLQNNDDGKLLPVLFHSRKFRAAKKNYSVYNKELLAIIEAFSIWRHFLIGSNTPIHVLTDHRNLLFFSTRRLLTPRHARW